MAKDPSMVIIRGRLAADPELRTVGAQATPVVNLRILSSGWEKDTAGQPVDLTPTSWNCEAWRGLAEHIAASLAKGSQVIAVARPKTDRFTAQDARSDGPRDTSSTTSLPACSAPPCRSRKQTVAGTADDTRPRRLPRRVMREP